MKFGIFTRLMWRRAATCAASAETISGPSSLAAEDAHGRADTLHGESRCEKLPELLSCVATLLSSEHTTVRLMAAMPWLHRLQQSNMSSLSRRQARAFKTHEQLLELWTFSFYNSRD